MTTVPIRDIVTRVGEAAIVAPGAPLVLGLDPARAHLFDAKTGKRL